MTSPAAKYRIAGIFSFNTYLGPGEPAVKQQKYHALNALPSTRELVMSARLLQILFLARSLSAGAAQMKPWDSAVRAEEIGVRQTLHVVVVRIADDSRPVSARKRAGENISNAPPPVLSADRALCARRVAMAAWHGQQARAAVYEAMRITDRWYGDFIKNENAVATKNTRLRPGGAVR